MCGCIGAEHPYVQGRAVHDGAKALKALTGDH